MNHTLSFISAATSGSWEERRSVPAGEVSEIRYSNSGQSMIVCLVNGQELKVKPGTIIRFEDHYE